MATVNCKLVDFLFLEMFVYNLLYKNEKCTNLVNLLSTLLPTFQMYEHSSTLDFYTEHFQTKTSQSTEDIVYVMTMNEINYIIK